MFMFLHPLSLILLLLPYLSTAILPPPSPIPNLLFDSPTLLPRLDCPNSTNSAPRVPCRLECYDPHTQQCCSGGHVCSKLLESCGPSTCCPNNHRQCGLVNPECFDPNRAICCESGGTHWTCRPDQTCARTLTTSKGCCGHEEEDCGGQCINKKQKQCCNRGKDGFGVCDADRLCCGEKCCDKGQLCADGRGGPGCWSPPSSWMSGNGTTMATTSAATELTATGSMTTGSTSTRTAARATRSRPPGEKTSEARSVYEHIGGIADAARLLLASFGLFFSIEFILYFCH